MIDDDDELNQAEPSPRYGAPKAHFNDRDFDQSNQISRFEDSREEKNDGAFKFDESESKSHERGETGQILHKRFQSNALTLVTSRSENSSTDFDRTAREEFDAELRMTNRLPKKFSEQ